MSEYKYVIRVEWKECDNVSLESTYDLYTELDHSKVSSMVAESMNFIGNILEINNE